MSDPTLNPYAPPETRHDDPSGQLLGSGEYRLEKHGLIMREPCQLPRVCFLSGEVSDLSACEFKIRVMPRWWAFVMPIVICGQQILVIPLMTFIAPKFTGPASGLSPLSTGILIGAFPGLLMISLIVLLRHAGRIVTVHASYSKKYFLKRRRKWRNITVTVVSALAGMAGILWLLFGGPLLVMAVLLLPILFGLVITLRLRKPWAYVAGSLTKDGDIAITGMHPEFFRTLRKLKTIAFHGDERT